MGHLPLKIQTSALFLKAKHAFSLHRKSSSNSASPTSPTSPALSTNNNNNNNNNIASSPGLLPATDSTASGTTSRTSSSASGSTNVTAALVANSSSSSSSSSSLTTGAGVIPHKMKRSSRFKMNKTFQSFRDRSTSPTSTSRPTLTSSNSSATTVTTITTATTATTATAATATTTTTSRTPLTPTPTTTPPTPVYSSNPYSSSWSPSTVAILKSPLRTRSSVASSKPSGSDLDLKSPHYSPAPNLILQPTPAVDFAPSYGMGARLSTSPTLLRHQSSDKTLTTVMQFRKPAIGPQGTHTSIPFHALPALMKHEKERAKRRRKE
ncbi:hypothetical protein CPC16_001807 [Podila verticillata]|nr:hypothetical protein CPC16_001807 [Podila verticillata]